MAKSSVLTNVYENSIYCICPQVNIVYILTEMDIDLFCNVRLGCYAGFIRKRVFVEKHDLVCCVQSINF